VLDGELPNGLIVGALCTADSPSHSSHSSSLTDWYQCLLEALKLRKDLSDDESLQLNELFREYQHVFALDSSELGSTNLVKHQIDTGDTKPINQHPRRISFALRDKVDKMVRDMLEQGVIQHSQILWASPIVLVAKRDGTMRFCVDYRHLNSATKMDAFPMPRIDDPIDILGQSKYFSTLDLRSGYW